MVWLGVDRGVEKGAMQGTSVICYSWSCKLLTYQYGVWWKKGKINIFRLLFDDGCLQPSSINEYIVRWYNKQRRNYTILTRLWFNHWVTKSALFCDHQTSHIHIKSAYDTGGLSSFVQPYTSHISYIQMIHAAGLSTSEGLLWCQ